MASQTSYYAKLEKPELGGHRLIHQFGYAKFTAKANTVSLATKLNTVKGFTWSWRHGAPTTVQTSGVVLRTTGTVVGNMVRLTRATLGAAQSGASFWFNIMGW